MTFGFALAIYYSLDRSGNPTVPRAAIRMEGTRIAEVRGIAVEQNLDSGAVAVVEEKLKEFPDGPNYQKRVADMRRLTNIENLTQDSQPLSAEDLIFLYEIDSEIEGFGFEKDPRIKEIRSQQKPEKDMPIVFGCEPDQIAHSVNEIRQNYTKAYVGDLESGIFDRLGNIEHIYTSFPEGRIKKETVEIGGRDFKAIFQELEDKLQIKDNLMWNQSKALVEKARNGSVKLSSQTLELLSELAEKQINVLGYAIDMIKNADFTISSEPINIDTVRLPVRALGLTGTPTMDQIYARADQFGLEVCPSELGVHKRFKDTNQPMGDWEYIAMKQIADRGGDPGVFRLVRVEVGIWLYYRWARPADRWDPESRFVFAVRKSDSLTPRPSGFFDRFFRH